MSDRVESFLKEFKAAIDTHRRFAADGSTVTAAKRDAEQLASALDRLTLSHGAPRSITADDLRALVQELSSYSPPPLEPFEANGKALLQLVDDGILDGDADGLRVLLSEAAALSAVRTRVRSSAASRLEAPARATCLECEEVVAGLKEGVARWDSLQNKVREHERDRHGGYSDELREELTRCRQALREGNTEVSAGRYQVTLA